MTTDARFLSQCPRRALQWEEEPDGRVVLFRPKFGAGRWGRRLAAWFRAKDYRIRLDEIGTLVWKCCDGKTPLAQVVPQLRREFGDRVEPAEDRLVRFVRQMLRGRLIEI